MVTTGTLSDGRNHRGVSLGLSKCEHHVSGSGSPVARRSRPIAVDIPTLIVHWANEFAPTPRRSWPQGAGGVPATQDRSHQRPRPNRRRPDGAMDGDLLYGSDTVCVWVPVGGRPDWSSDRRSLMGIVGDLDVHRSHSTSKAGGRRESRHPGPFPSTPTSALAAGRRGGFTRPIQDAPEPAIRHRSTLPTSDGPDRSHQRPRPNRRRAVGAGSPAQYRMRPNPPSDIGRRSRLPTARTVPINAHVRIGGVP
jgi:hypothetical protein